MSIHESLRKPLMIYTINSNPTMIKGILKLAKVTPMTLDPKIMKDLLKRIDGEFDHYNALP